ncbi:MAG: hypothetical protein WEE64_10400 [Dehalococcoidia bacterium]
MSDAVVARAPRTGVAVPDDSEFDAFAFEGALPALARKLTRRRAAR